MLNARTFREIVTLYSESTTEGDYGNPITTYVNKGSYPADVRMATGSKAIYYQEKGISHMIEIKLRKTDFDISKIEWNGQTIQISSMVLVNDEDVSDTRGNYFKIIGGLKK